MKLSQFKFEIPAPLIAQYPAKNREDARLMVVHRKTKKIEHLKFKDILEMFDDKDVLVVNNTKVFPARLYGKKEKTGAKIEVFLMRELNKSHRLWDVIVEPARKIRVGNKLYFGPNGDTLVAEVVDNTTSRGRTIRIIFDGTDDELRETLYGLGETPIPRYIKRKVEDADATYYQSIFAKEEGAVAPPTSALHFSRELVKRMELKGTEFAEYTMHLSLGTYRQIEVEDLTKHKMDAEYFKIDEKCAKVVNRAIDLNKKICAVGTATLRALENAVDAHYHLKATEGWTNLFVHPPHQFTIPNCLITNFHPPKSSLLILTTSFGGYDLIMNAYKIAIKEKYRFLAYGDAMMIVD